MVLTKENEIPQSLPLYQQRLTLKKQLKKGYSIDSTKAYRTKIGRKSIFESKIFKNVIND